MIYLIRHGESEANVNKRYCGITDVGLSTKGLFQSYEAGINLKPHLVSKIYTSPLKRAHKTAQIISGVINKEVNIENSLIEINFGIFENMTWDEMQINNEAETKNWIKLKNRYKFPQGECYEDIINRIAPFLDSMEDNSAIVTHFGVIQSILLYYKIADYESLWNYSISNCDILFINNNSIDRILNLKHT